MQLAAPHGAAERPRHERAQAPLPHQALLGPHRHLPDRRAVLAGQLEGQQHLPVLRQSARRAAPGVDHRPDRHRHDGGHHHRRHRPVRRFADGDLQRRLRHAADRRGRHAGGRHGPADGRSRRADDRLRGGALRLRQYREGARSAASVGRDVSLDTMRGVDPAARRRRGACRPAALVPAAAGAHQVRRARRADRRAMRRASASARSTAC